MASVESESQEPLATSRPYRRTRRLLSLWIVALLALGLLGACCGFLLTPYLEVRAALKKWESDEYMSYPEGVYNTGSFDEVVVQLGGPTAAAKKLGRYAQLPDRLAPYKEWATECLGSCGPEGIPYLTYLLRTGTVNVRCEAAYTLARTGGPRAVEPLIVELGNTDPRVRAAAAKALGLLGCARALPALEAIADSDADRHVRNDARKALKYIRRTVEREE